MTMPYNAKALVAAVLSGLGTVGTDAATNPHGVTGTTGIAATVMALVGYFGTYWTTNGASAKSKASGLVVTLKTDADTFLSTVLAGLPGLVQNAMQAALKPAPAAVEAPVDPAPAAPTDAAAPVVEPAILGKA